jgi:hypothetical protein
VGKKQKIISMKVQNLQNVTVGELYFGDNPVVEVSGNNGAGKSSFISGIDLVLHGKKALGLEPVKRGEKTAIVEIESTDLIVEVTVPHKGATKYKVTNKADGTVDTTRDLIKEFFGGVEVNPEDIGDMSALEQYRLALGLTGKQKEIDALKAERKIVFSDRTDAKRDYDKASAQIQGMTAPDPKLPKEETPASALTTELSRIHKIAMRKNGIAAEIESFIVEDKRLNNDAIECRENITRLEKEIEDWKASLEIVMKSTEENSDRISKAQKVYKGITVPDTGKIDLQIAENDANNIKIREAKAYNAKKAECKGLGKIYFDLDNRIDAIDQQNIDILKSSELPIKGLEVDTANDILRYNGDPLKQLSKAQQIRVCAFMVIKKNANAPLFVVWNASVIDDNLRKEIIDFAIENGAQGIFESIKPSELPGIQFENGFGTEKEATSELGF